MLSLADANRANIKAATAHMHEVLQSRAARSQPDGGKLTASRRGLQRASISPWTPTILEDAAAMQRSNAAAEALLAEDEAEKAAARRKEAKARRRQR